MQESSTPEEMEAARPVDVMDVNVLLHQSRGAYLRGLAKGAYRMLSAGCAAGWYFSWIEDTYGYVPEHLGIEYYMPKPDVLPGNVTWIANTASDMSAVSSETCDLVFSGQNLEHLWPEEVAGFVLEAARVLRPGGTLAVDSPNRSITAALGWSHPEHTIELTSAEFQRVLHVGGFDVTATYGIWLCRDGRTGGMLPFQPSVPAGGWSVTERLLAARDRPDDSFIWWIEATRAERAPDELGVKQMMSALFEAHWPERTGRMLVLPGREVRDESDGRWVVLQPGQDGPAIYGPYMPLRAGRYRVTWRFRTPAQLEGMVAFCDIIDDTLDKLVDAALVHAGDTEASLVFELGKTTFGLQFRCISLGKTTFSVRKGVDIEAL